MRTISAQSSGRIISAGSIPDHSAIGVSTKPGQIAIARTPSAVELLVQRARQRDHGRLRRAVDRRGPASASCPAIEARLTIQPCEERQERDRRLGDEEEAAQVDADLEVEVPRRQILDAARRSRSPAELTSMSSRRSAPRWAATRACALVGVPDVRRHRFGAELGRGRLDLLDAARDERQPEALVAQHAGDREADPRRASGDERRAFHTRCLFERGGEGQAGSVANGTPRVPSGFPLPRRRRPPGRRLRTIRG